MASCGWIRSNYTLKYRALEDPGPTLNVSSCRVNSFPFFLIKSGLWSSIRVFTSDPLHAHGNAHPSSDAQRRHALVAPGPLKCVQQGHQHSAAGHAEWMSQRDGTAAHIHLRTELHVSAVVDSGGTFAPAGKSNVRPCSTTEWQSIIADLKENYSVFWTQALFPAPQGFKILQKHLFFLKITLIIELGHLKRLCNAPALGESKYQKTKSKLKLQSANTE